MRSFLGVLVAITGAALLSVAVATPISPPIDEVQLLSDTSVAGYQIPAAQTFTISGAGVYTITLADGGSGTPGGTNELPPLKSLQMAVVSSTATQASFTAAGTKTVSLLPGTYTVQVLAQPDTTSPSVGGAYSWYVSSNTSSSTCSGQCSFPAGVVGLPSTPVNGVTTYHQQFTVTQSDSYTLTLTDDAFPSALQPLSSQTPVVQAIVTPASGGPAALLWPAAAVSNSNVLTAGTYDLYVLVSTTNAAGLYSVTIQGTSTTPVATTQPVGTMPAPISLSIPNASAGQISLKLTDLSGIASSGAALTALTPFVVQNGTALTLTSGTGGANFTVSNFTAAAGKAQLFIWAQPPNSGGQGVYAAYAYDSASTPLLDTAQSVLAPGSYGFAYPTATLAAGSYQLSVNDFRAPTALASLCAIVVQQGDVPGGQPACVGNSPNTTFTAQAGAATIVALPALTQSTDEGLFGLALLRSSDGGTFYETTQGVGASFVSLPLSITNVGNYVAQATDLGFPANFHTLGVYITQGQSVVGEISGAGRIPFSAGTAGTYSVNILTQVAGSNGVGTDVGYGLYGLHVAVAAAAPTVTLTASSTSVASGQSATLTWSSSNATGCTVSGGTTGSGEIALATTSGSMSSGALTAATRFTVICTGADGTTATASVSIDVTAAAPSGGKSGGGGAWTPGSLLPLGLFAAGVSWRRRRAPKMRRPPEPPLPRPTGAGRLGAPGVALSSAKVGSCG